jgi:hypothetical protein
MKELENKHNQEIIKLEKSFKIQCKSNIIQRQYLSQGRKQRPGSYRIGIDKLASIIKFLDNWHQ